MRRRRSAAPVTDDPLFATVDNAAARAAQQVLEEDRLLREAGIQPKNGRSR